MEAGLIVAALQDAGVDAMMTGVDTAGFRAEAPGRVQIRIHQHDREYAEQLLAGFAEHREDVDWSQIDFDDSDTSSAETGVLSLGNWKRIAQVLILIYVGWLAAGIVWSMLRIALDVIEDFVS